MTALEIAGQVLELRVANEAARHLESLIARIGNVEHLPATHTLSVRGNRPPRLAIDGHGHRARLDLPPVPAVHGGPTTVEIAVLQAAARSLAVMALHDVVLLHGGAISMDDGASAVAVLDGGRGQGKTSLAMGLARRDGQLLVDEFAFATFAGSRPAIVALPSLPWHLRADMSPLLASGSTDRLLHREELTSAGYASGKGGIVPLGLILIPDRSLAAGRVRPLSRDAARGLLRAAVTDHGAKLRNPALDHVSIFTSSEQIDIRSAEGFAAVAEERALDMLGAVPAFRAGIGTPADLPRTVDAAISLGIGAR